MSDRQSVPAPAMPGVDLVALATLEREATRAPWETEGNGLETAVVAPDGAKGLPHYDEDEAVPICVDCCDENEARNPADMDLIVAARNALPALIAELRDLRRLAANVLA